ncbi:hypothetical protein [Endozoicomonas sp. 8E]|uniref:hypothetical protein n=1 Tax=Endozoicomonas sp. 8E TaxID=3035692 RepID=UPI002938D081|nr:hypothetical protein [Endozoicomonas sp. 8E]WOG28482.1 hypothetical protein P6910_02165 [Endozoicomonas sp. 8E]
MKNSILLLLICCLSAICQAKSLKRSLVVEFEQNGGFQSGSFSIKSGQHPLSGILSYPADKNDYAGSTLPPENESFRLGGYDVKTSLVESVLWQLVHATNLPVVYELVLTTHDGTLSGKPYSWLPVEAFVAVGWLMKNYWNPDSPLFNPMDQVETSHYDPFVITTMMLPGRDQPSSQPSSQQSSQQPTQRASGTLTRLTDSFANLLSSGFGGDDQGPDQQQHTLGLNCYVDSCHGVCKLLQSSDNSAEGPLNSVKSSTAHEGATSGQASSPDITGRSFTSPLVYFDRNTFMPVTDAPPDELNNQFFVDFSDIHRIDINLTNGCKNPRSLLWVSPRHP